MSIHERRLIPYLPSIIAGVFIIGLGIYADGLYRQNQEQTLRRTVFNEASALGAKIERQVTSNVLLMKGLVGALNVTPDMSQEHFAMLAKYLFEQPSQLRNIGAAPDMVIRYIYPVQGNEAAIGLDYRTLPDQLSAVLYARDLDRLVIAGPLNLVQGGRGFIARAPVFLIVDGGRKDKFWGMVSAVIDEDEFYQESGLANDNLNIDVAIRGKDSQGKQGDVFFGSKDIFSHDPELVDIMLPYGSWQMAAIPKGGWSQSSSSIILFRLMLVIVGLLVLIPLITLGRSYRKNLRNQDALRVFKTFADSSLQGMGWVTIDGVIQYVNPALMKIFGETDISVVTGKNVVFSYYSESEQARLEKEIFPRIINDGFWSGELRLKNKYGSPVPTMNSLFLIRDDNGDPYYFANIVTDITEQKQAENEKFRLQRELQQAQQMESLGQLTSGIAHDFNNLLAVINGHAELALGKYLDDKNRLVSCVNNIKDAGERAASLVSQMQVFNRVDDVADEPIQLGPLIRQEIEMLCSTFPASITIKQKIEEDLPLVFMSGTQLHQILMNLAVNARDAMKESGTLTITLGWVRGVETISLTTYKPIRGDWVELCVSDTGSGVALDIREKIFNPFFTTKDVGKGSGMGLSVIYRIMENHGGHILLEGKPGEGSTFRMLFPPVE